MNKQINNKYFLYAIKIDHIYITYLYASYAFSFDSYIHIVLQCSLNNNMYLSDNNVVSWIYSLCQLLIAEHHISDWSKTIVTMVKFVFFFQFFTQDKMLYIYKILKVIMIE